MLESNRYNLKTVHQCSEKSFTYHLQILHQTICGLWTHILYDKPENQYFQNNLEKVQ